jgi:hypothetical protein
MTLTVARASGSYSNGTNNQPQMALSQISKFSNKKVI